MSPGDERVAAASTFAIAGGVPRSRSLRMTAPTRPLPVMSDRIVRAIAPCAEAAARGGGDPLRGPHGLTQAPAVRRNG